MPMAENFVSYLRKLVPLISHPSLVRYALRRRTPKSQRFHPIAQYFLGYSVHGKGVIDQVNGVQIEYEFSQDIGQTLFFRGEFEEFEIRLSSERMTQKDLPLILDIGANIGWHTVNWARRCPNASIIAFEPNPDTRVNLHRNIAHNALSSRVMVRSEALSNFVGTAEFIVTTDDAYNSLKDTGRKPILKTIDVPVTRIDTFAKDYDMSRVALIKIDVEGLETEVISGAAETLTRFHPDLLVEIYRGTNSNLDPVQTIDFLSSLGYLAYVLENGQAIPFTQYSDEQYSFYFSVDRLHTSMSRAT